MKFGPLIEYNMRKIYLEKLYTKYGEETDLSSSFSKKSKLSIFLDPSSKVWGKLFLLYAKLKAVDIYWN